jgi:hypothetical protein
MKHPPRNAIIVLLLSPLVIIPLTCFHTIKIPTTTPDRITVTGNGNEPVAVITNPARIAKVIDFLAAHRRGWQTTSWYTFPTPKYELVFESNGQSPFTVWVGSETSPWLGFDAVGGKLLKNISATEHSELLDLLITQSAPTTQHQN